MKKTKEIPILCPTVFSEDLVKAWPEIEKRIANGQCPNCGVALLPDLEAKIFGTEEWDGHTFKAGCECMPKNVRICIG